MFSVQYFVYYADFVLNELRMQMQFGSCNAKALFVGSKIKPFAIGWHIIPHIVYSLRVTIVHSLGVHYTQRNSKYVQ